MKEQEFLQPRYQDRAPVRLRAVYYPDWHGKGTGRIVELEMDTAAVVPSIPITVRAKFNLDSTWASESLSALLHGRAIEVKKLRLWLFGVNKIVVLLSDGKEENFETELTLDEVSYIRAILEADIERQQNIAKAETAYAKATKDAQEQLQEGVEDHEQEG